MSDTIETQPKTDPTDDKGQGQSGSTGPQGQGDDLKNKQEQLDKEIASKEAKLQNLSKAVEEAQSQLEKSRKEKQSIASGEGKQDEGDLQIDFNDPGAKLWDKHISDKLTPLQIQVEKEKAEVRKFALAEFLKDKPALARDPDKLKELMATYDSLKTATERNKEGVLIDLNKAFAAVYHEDLIQAAQTAKFERIREKQIFSEPAVSEGATGYVNEREVMPQYSKEDREILAKWGITPEQHWEMQKEQRKKAAAQSA